MTLSASSCQLFEGLDMPANFSVIPERRLVYMKFFSDAHISECHATIAQVMAHPEWQPSFAILVDNSELTSYIGDFSEMQVFCRELEESRVFEGACVPVAYFAPSDLGFGIGRMAQQMLSASLPFEIYVFRDEMSALACLGQRELHLSALFAATS